MEKATENTNEKRALTDDMLDEVSGGVMVNQMSGSLLRSAVYDKSEGAGLSVALKDDTMDGQIRLLDGSTRSGKTSATGQDTLFGQKIQKA